MLHTFCNISSSNFHCLFLQFTIGSRLEGHTGSVTVLDALYVNSSRLLIATSSVDSTVKIWERADIHGISMLDLIIYLFIITALIKFS